MSDYCCCAPRLVVGGGAGWQLGHQGVRLPREVREIRDSAETKEGFGGGVRTRRTGERSAAGGRCKRRIGSGGNGPAGGDSGAEEQEDGGPGGDEGRGRAKADRLGEREERVPAPPDGGEGKLESERRKNVPSD